eukprot:COSAG01_NODE_1908_length_8929_cov_219.706195_15_plen_138_part_01
MPADVRVRNSVHSAQHGRQQDSAAYHEHNCQAGVPQEVGEDLSPPRWIMAYFAPGAHAPPLQTVQSISPGESVKVRLPAFDIQVLPWSSLYLHHHGGLSAPQERHRRPEPGSGTLALATVAQEGGCLAAPGGGGGGGS